MKTLKIFTRLFFVLLIISCSQKQDKIDESNSIPYPLAEWKGIQGKVLA